MSFIHESWFVIAFFTSPFWLTGLAIASLTGIKNIFFARRPSIYLLFLASIQLIAIVAAIAPEIDRYKIWDLYFIVLGIPTAITHLITIAASIYLVDSKATRKLGELYGTYWVLFIVSAILVGVLYFLGWADHELYLSAIEAVGQIAPAK